MNRVGGERRHRISLCFGDTQAWKPRKEQGLLTVRDVESCTRTCAGCRHNGESTVRRGHGRTDECTAKTVVVGYGEEKHHGRDGQEYCAVRRVFRACARFGEDRYVSRHHHPMAYVAATGGELHECYVCYSLEKLLVFT